MNLRDEAKSEAKKSGFVLDWAVYQKLRNFVVKINRESKREFYLDAINKSEKNPKSMWNTINGFLGRCNHVTPTSVECNAAVFTKSKDSANYYIKCFIRISALMKLIISHVKIIAFQTVTNHSFRTFYIGGKPAVYIINT